MSVRLTLVTLICGWSLVSTAPAITKKQEIKIQNDKNDIDFSLPNFSVDSSDVDLNQTVDQVEQILKAYPSLPRLSKAEILNLVNNITAEDKLKNQAKKSSKSVLPKQKETAIKTNRSHEGKALMVVMPFKATDGNITELFTKAPIIRYISPKPVVTTEKTTDSESTFTNHKYTNEKSMQQDKHTLQDDYWQDQAQKVMKDLKQQTANVSPNLEQKEKIKSKPNELPFKKMPPLLEIPQAFNPKLPIISRDLSSTYPENPESITLQSFQPTVAEDVNNLVLSMGLYDTDKASEKLPFKYLDSENPDAMKLYEYTQQPSGLYDQIQLKAFSTSSDNSAYVAFKPLPVGSKAIDEAKDLDEILKSYGILGAVNGDYLPVFGDDSDSAKNYDFLKNTEFIEPDLFPADMTSMLTEMGLTNKRGRKLTHLPSKNYESKTKTPTDLDVNETDGYALRAGPDPMSVEELYPNKEYDMVKRQEKQTEPVTEKIIEIAVTSTVENNEKDSKSDSANLNENENSTEKSNNSDESKTETSANESPNLEDLESSFGASPADKDPSELVLPPPRKNGFYYMLDWNSFLEVGDGSNKVNILFNPKLGDPQRFLAVNVP